MRERPAPDIFELACQKATDVVGETTSVEELADAVAELADRDPQQARHAIETVAARLDEATMGRHTDELQELELAALEALGLHAKRMIERFGHGTGDAAAGGEGAMPSDPHG